MLIWSLGRMAICILYFWYVHLHPWMHLKLINNGNKTKWSPLWSFIIGVINKIGQPQSRGQICLSQVWLQTGLDDTKSCYQLIIKLIWQNLRKKIDIFDRFSGKKSNISSNSAKYETTARKHDAFCPLTQTWHVNCPFNCHITRSNYKHDTYMYKCSNQAGDML